ncbi:MAG: universal stress protein [Gemmatimonadota bacterium]
MYRSILIPLDGSSISEWAIPSALTIAQRVAAGINLITVEHMMPSGFDDDGVHNNAQTWQSALHDPTTYLSGLARQIRHLIPTPVTFEVLSGPETIAHQVVQYARDSDNDLIVMNTHGRGGFTRSWLGSVADQMVRHSHLPTLLVKLVGNLAIDLQVQPTVRSVLIPLDASDASPTIVDHALAIGGLEPEYTLLQAVPLISAFTPEYAVAAGQISEDVRSAQCSAAQDLLEKVASRIRERNPAVKVRTAVVNGNAVAYEILAYANQQSIDLIAMTTHGRGGALRLMIGSVADKVMRGSVVPVLLYRPA